MSKYNVIVSDEVIGFIDRLGKAERERIMKRLRLLKENPQSAGEPRGKFWILKVGRSGYRIAFHIDENEKTVTVSAIEKRKSSDYKEFYR